MPCELGDVEGVLGVSSTGDVASGSTFGEWWRGVLGVNITDVLTLTMTRDRNGHYVFINDNFRPIDGSLMGNEGDLHNYHFTLELDASFTYDAAGGQFFQFRGTDDAYMFINGKLVLDLGGMAFNKVQYVDLDRMGLNDGEKARMQFFHAQRQRGLAIFRLKTNVVLADAAPTPSISSVLED